MNIDPELITRCAAAGTHAAQCSNSSLLSLDPYKSSDQNAREAFARSAIETYLHSSSPGDLMAYIDSHPDIREGEVFVDAVLRLLRERDDLKARVAQLEWRPVSVPPTSDDADRRGFVATLSPFGCSNDHSVDLYDRWENVAYWRPYTVPPVTATFERWWATATEDEKRTAAQRDWESTRACKGGAQ